MKNTYDEVMELAPDRRRALLDSCEEVSDYELEKQYIDMLNDSYESVNIAGYEYDVASALKSVDPTAYRCGLSDWLGTNDDYYIEIEGSTYRTPDLNNALNNLGDDNHV